MPRPRPWRCITHAILLTDSPTSHWKFSTVMIRRRAARDFTVLPFFFWVCCEAPKTIYISIRIPAIIFIQACSWMSQRSEIFVAMRALRTPLLTSPAISSFCDCAAIVFTIAINAVRRGGCSQDNTLFLLVIWCGVFCMIITTPEIAVLPDPVGVCGETPRAVITVWVPTIVLPQIRVWEFFQYLFKIVWGLGVPGLAFPS